MNKKETKKQTLKELLDFLPAGFEKNKWGNEKYTLTIKKIPKHFIDSIGHREWQVSYSTSDGMGLLNDDDCFFEGNDLEVVLNRLADYIKSYIGSRTILKRRKDYEKS